MSKYIWDSWFKPKTRIVIASIVALIIFMATISPLLNIFNTKKDNPNKTISKKTSINGNGNIVASDNATINVKSDPTELATLFTIIKSNSNDPTEIDAKIEKLKDGKEIDNDKYVGLKQILDIYRSANKDMEKVIEKLKGENKDALAKAITISNNSDSYTFNPDLLLRDFQTCFKWPRKKENDN